MRLILTRHGETEENKKGINQGWLPGHLTKRGKEQAELLAKRLKVVEIDYIYTSDLKRCLDTAKKIAKYHLKAEFIKEKALRERCTGEFQGKSRQEIDWDSLSGTFFTCKPKNGENYVDLWKRVEKFYKRIIKKHTKDTLLIVSHGGPIRFLHCLIKHKNMKESEILEKFQNTAISEFEINKGGNNKVVCLNCKNHL